MTTSNFAFNPADGLRNAVSFPTTPASEADARNQPQTLLDQLRDYINNTIVAAINAKLDLAGGVLTGNLTLPALISSGLTGATAGGRFVGATTSGAPTAGTFIKGDFVIDQTGAFWVCNTAGTPGVWTKVGGASNTAVSASGGYTGDGTANRVINVGFRAKSLTIVSSAAIFGLAVDDGTSTLSVRGANSAVLAINATSFTINDSVLNTNGTSYKWEVTG